MSIQIAAITLPYWNDRRTNVELWVFSDTDWTDVDNIQHGAGNVNDKVWTQRVTGLTVNTTAKTITIPAWSIKSTTDALVNPLVRYYFHFMAVAGNNATPIKPYPNTENGIMVPPTIASITACSPYGTCAVYTDLIYFSQFALPTPRPNFTYSDAQIDQKIAAASVVAGGVDLSSNQTVAGNKSFTGITKFGAQANVNDNAWAGTGASSLMAHGSDSTIASPSSSGNASLTYQTSRSGGALGIGVFGYQFGLNKISGEGDTYIAGFLNRYSADMSGFEAGDYNQHGIVAHVVLAPTGVTSGRNLYGYNVLKVERIAVGVRGVALQPEAVNNAGDADDDGTSLNSMIGCNIAGGGAYFNSVALQIESGATGATSFGVGIRPKRNSVRLTMMDFVTGGLYDITGTVTVTNGSPTIAGVGTKFTQEFRKGDPVTKDGVTWYEVASTPVSNTSMTLTTNYAGTTQSGQTLVKTVTLVRGVRPSYYTFTDTINDFRVFGLDQNNHTRIDIDGTGIYAGTAPTQITNAAGQLLTTGLVSYSACAYNSANISIPNGVETVLTLNSERWDNATIHSTSANTSRMTAPVDGVYLITANIEFDANATGERYVAIRLNGGTYLAAPTIDAAGGGLNTGFAFTRQYALSAGDYIEIWAFQNSGGALNVVASGNRSPEVQMTRVASAT